jgi:imidazole glycerol-phosphate synthase subunit HisF
MGGGIRSLKDIQNALDVGADKVAINSQAFRDNNFIQIAVETFGSQAIVGSVVGIKHKNHWEAFMDNAKNRTNKDAVEWAKTIEARWVG